MQEGQSIIEFDKMCEVQSDKASVEITSRYSGTVLRLHAAEGDIVQVLLLKLLISHSFMPSVVVLESDVKESSSQFEYDKELAEYANGITN